MRAAKKFLWKANIRVRPAIRCRLCWKPADAPKIVHIGYQKSGFLLLVRSEGTLEKRLEPLGYAVEWHEFTSGPPLLEAMNSGAVDFGHSGQPPPVFAQASDGRYLGTAESGIRIDAVA
jgi:sulfonate transport system substrate-binding protein